MSGEKNSLNYNFNSLSNIRKKIINIKGNNVSDGERLMMSNNSGFNINNVLLTNNIGYFGISLEKVKKHYVTIVRSTIARAAEIISGWVDDETRTRSAV